MARDVRCSGIVMQVGAPGTEPAAALRQGRAVVARTLRGDWRVELLAPRARDVMVTAASGRSLGIGRAWDLTRDLVADREVADAEPAFRTAGLEPEESAAGGRPELGVAPKSFGRERHLTCTRKTTWSLTLCRVQEAWKRRPSPGGARYGKGIVVGHPDTGYTRHDEIWGPASRRRVLPDQGYDFEDDRADPRDPLTGKNPSHGTSTASVIMSDHVDSPPEPDVSGVAPAARLIPFRVSDSVVHFNFDNVARAIYASVDQGAHVISMSLGGPFGSRFLERAIDHAIESGVIVLAAAGNVWPWVVHPAKYGPVIAVAAVNCQKKPWRHSASGSTVDISAPGESVWRAVTQKASPDDDYQVGRSSGTSYAVATTAGAAAVWLAHHGRRRLIRRYGARHLASVFRELLETHGFERPSGWDTESHGVGILRVDRLVDAILPARPPATPKTFGPLRDPVGRIAEYLPGADRARLRTSLARMLSVGESELDETLARYQDELLFHVATNPDLREDLIRSSRRSAAKSASPRRGVRANPRLRRETSRPLRRQMGIEPARKRPRRR